MTVILVSMINSGGRLAIDSHATPCGPSGVMSAGGVTFQGNAPHPQTQRTPDPSTTARRRAESAGGGAIAPGAVTSSAQAARA
jgi:hypothetical protein